MPLYMPCDEQWQGKDETGCASMLLTSPNLEMLHSAEQKDLETDFCNDLLMDFFELKNLGEDDVPYVLLPSGGPLLAFPIYPQISASYLCGPLTSAYKVMLPPNGTIFFVRLRTGGMTWLVDQPAFSFANQAVPMGKVLVDTMQLQNHLRSISTFQQRCSAFLHYLERCGADTFHIDPITKTCVDFICEHHGIGRVYEVAAVVDRSERFLGRVFRETVGMSVKKYFEIVRFKNSLYSLLITRPRVLSDVVSQYGYYDLPHMNRAYRTFLGYTANEVRYLNIENLYVPELFLWD